MGILLCFPSTSTVKPKLHLRDSQANPDLALQLKFFQELAEECFRELAGAPLSGAVNRLETALGNIDAIGCLLPPGEFKTQFDLDRSALAIQLEQTKGELVRIRQYLDGHASLRGSTFKTRRHGDEVRPR